jgi:hypothetical protein
MKRIHALIAAALLLVGLPGLATAGGYLVVTNTGVPYAWDNSAPIPYNPDQGGLGTMNNAAAVAFTQTAMDVWSALPETDLTVASAGPMPIDVIDAVDFFLFWQQIDGLSPVVFDETGFLFDQLFGAGSGVLGFATVEVISTVAPFEIVESFQAYNGLWIDGVDSGLNFELPLANFGAVISHEFGHALNLDHNQVNGHFFIGDNDDPGFALYGVPPNGSVEMMFPFLFGTALDALTPLTDDAVWAAVLYPGAGASGVEITGSVYRPDAVTPFQGANIIVRNPADPFFDAYSCVSGHTYFPTFPYPAGGVTPAAAEGEYRIPNVTPGVDYSVEMVQVNPNFTGGSSVGPLSPPVALSIEEFYNGANESFEDPPDDPSDQTLVPAGGAADLIINGLVDPNEPNDDPANCTPLAYGGTGAGIIEPSGDQDWFCFSGNVNDIIDAEMLAFRNGTGLDPTLTLVDTDGSTILAFNDDFFSLDSRISTCLPSTGTFYLVVQGYAGVSTGEYELFLEMTGTGDTEPNDDAGTAIPLADTCPTSGSGCIAPAGDRDFFALTVSAPATLQINMDTQDIFGSPDAYLRLYDTDGTTVLDEDDDGGPGFDSQITWSFAAAGTYYIECLTSPIFDPNGTGIYSVTAGAPPLAVHGNNHEVDNAAGGETGWSSYAPASLGGDDHAFDGHYGIYDGSTVDDGEDADFVGTCMALYDPASDKDEKTADLFDENVPVALTGTTDLAVHQTTLHNDLRCDGSVANWTLVRTVVVNNSAGPQDVKWYKYLDMDVGPSFSNDDAGFDGGRNLVYQFDVGGPYVGIALLQGNFVGYQVNNFLASTSPNNNDAARADFMNGLNLGDLSSAGLGDKNSALASDLGTIPPGGSAEIWWVVAAGTSLADLQADVDDAALCVPIQASVDIHPGSCPNPVNPKSMGVIPVTIHGSADLDVSSIDPSSILLEGVPPIRWTIADAGTPASCDCNSGGGPAAENDVPDGYPDLVLKFRTQDVVAAVGPVSHNDVKILTLTASAGACGQPVIGGDCVIFKGKALQIVDGSKPDQGGITFNFGGIDVPVREITYSVPADGQVRLQVFSVTGRLVDSLVDSYTVAGSHTVRWDSTNHPNGIYFLRLKTAEEAFTRKLIVAR